MILGVLGFLFGEMGKMGGLFWQMGENGFWDHLVGPCSCSQLALGIWLLLYLDITTASITHLAGVMLAVLPAPTNSLFEQPIYIISMTANDSR